MGTNQYVSFFIGNEYSIFSIHLFIFLIPVDTLHFESLPLRIDNFYIAFCKIKSFSLSFWHISPIACPEFWVLLVYKLYVKTFSGFYIWCIKIFILFNKRSIESHRNTTGITLNDFGVVKDLRRKISFLFPPALLWSSSQDTSRKNSQRKYSG